MWIAILLITAIFVRNQKHKIRLFTLGALVFFLFSNGFIFNEIMRLWEIRPVKNERLQTYKVGIVLGGMSSYDDSLKRISFKNGIDRLLQGMELYKQGKIEKLMISGGSGRLVKEEREALYLRIFLLNMGFPEHDLIIESESRNTYENAVFSAAILKKHYSPQTRFLLLTSAFHMRRSIKCFEKAGLKVNPYSTDIYSGKRVFYLDHLLFPVTHVFEGWDVLLHEWFGFISYKIAGYI